MADLKEFQSFVSKFVNLWKEGKDAKFQVCSNAGKATIKLELEMGDVLLPPVAPQNKQVDISEDDSKFP